MPSDGAAAATAAPEDDALAANRRSASGRFWYLSRKAAMARS
jgi:hypothetical protein